MLEELYSRGEVSNRVHRELKGMYEVELRDLEKDLSHVSFELHIPVDFFAARR